MAKAANQKDVSQSGLITVKYVAVVSCHFDHNGKEYSLHFNETYQLPDCPFVQSLIGQERLLVEKK